MAGSRTTERGLKLRSVSLFRAIPRQQWFHRYINYRRGPWPGLIPNQPGGRIASAAVIASISSTTNPIPSEEAHSFARLTPAEISDDESPPTLDLFL